MIIVRKHGTVGVRVPAEIVEQGDAAVAAYVASEAGEVCPELEALDMTAAAIAAPAPAVPAHTKAPARASRTAPTEG